MVEGAKFDFIPLKLVVETFGVWSPFAPRALYSIADCTFAKSGASTKVASRNLLELLLY